MNDYFDESNPTGPENNTGCCPVGLAAIILFFLLMNVCMSCVTPKEFNRSVDLLTQLKADIEQMDSSIQQVNSEVNRNVSNVKESQGETIIERNTIYYLPPDSLGNQYKASVSVEKESNRTSEKDSYSEEYSAKFSEILTTLSTLKSNVEDLTKRLESEKVTPGLTWWQRLKMDAGLVLIGVAVGAIFLFVFKIVKSVKSVGWKAALKLIFKTK